MGKSGSRITLEKAPSTTGRYDEDQGGRKCPSQNRRWVFKNETRARIGHVQKQISQLATSVSKLEEREGKLPSQDEHNPPTNVSLVATRSGAVTGKESKVEKILEPAQKKEEDEKYDKKTSQDPKDDELIMKIFPPFPRRL